MSDKLFESTIDTLLPDLIAEGPFLDETMFTGVTSAVVTPSDILNLSSKMDNLIIAVNTQALQIEVERVKRRKLQSSVRFIKQNLSSPCQDAVTLKQEMQAARYAQDSLNFQFDDAIIQLNTVSFRCVARIHQLMATAPPYLSMPPDNHLEISQLLDELLRTLRQYSMLRQAIYV